MRCPVGHCPQGLNEEIHNFCEIQMLNSTQNCKLIMVSCYPKFIKIYLIIYLSTINQHESTIH